MPFKTFIFTLCWLILPVHICSGKTVIQELIDGIDFNRDIKLVSYMIGQEPADNSRNPGNTVFRLPRYTGVLELRQEMSLSFRNFELNLKPRLSQAWTKVEFDNDQEETDQDTDLFMNEFLIRFMVTNQLFVSYGRENLQWGPGWLFSPSNPFFSDNGRSNPKIEIAGMDFARLVYLPNMTWTVSLISNLDEGRQELARNEEFNKKHAIKLDFTGQETYAGLILTYEEEGETSLGLYGGWTFNDATLLYTDMSLSENDNPSDSCRSAILIGGSYTLEAGPTLTLEYGHQENFPTFSTRDNLMLQYSHNNIRDILNITLVLTTNLNDHSSQFTANAEYLANDHIQLFLYTTTSFGEEGDEFGSTLDYRVMTGLEYSF